MNLLDLMVTIGIKDEASEQLGSVKNKLGKGLQTAAKVGIAAVGAAATAIGALTKQSVASFAEYEQLAGGAGKIFGDSLSPQIFADAQKAYADLNMSANEYLATINDVGATFASTMGKEAGYETARQGLKAISDYASGTGKNVNELAAKFTMITRSAASYQSIADQFSGILPATSAGFLEQAQAAGLLGDNYKSLTEVPLPEYQAAVAGMLEKGVASLGLAGNTAAEAFSTISGSLAATKAAWSNLLTGLADDNANFESLLDNFVESATAAVQNLMPRIAGVLTGIGALITSLAPIMIEALPALVESVVPSLLTAGVALISALVQGIIQALPVIISTATDLILTFVNGLSANAETVVATAIQLISTLVSGIIIALPQIMAAAVNLVLAFIEAIGNKFNDIIIAGNDIIKKLGEGITNMLDVIYNAGATVVQMIIDGISSAWGNLVSWFEGLWASLFSNRSVSVGVNYGGGADSSNAIGLDRVPFNGYIAELHKDEAVLNAREASAWRNGMSGGKSQPIVLNINNVTELDGAVIARKTYTYNLQEQNKHGAKLINA